MHDLVITRRGAVATLTLNRPAAMNALSMSLRRTLVDAVRALDGDDTIHALILTGAGERAFCAGLDLKELETNTEALSADSEDWLALDPTAAIRTCAKPVIAAVNGVAIAGGLELVLACDVIFASRSARFADTHGRVGVLPGWGLSQMLSRIIGPLRAKEMSLSGNFVSAETAERWGLVNRVVKPGDLLKQAEALADDMAQIAPAMQSRMKRLIDDGYALALADALQLEHQVFRSQRAPAPGFGHIREDVIARGRSMTNRNRG